MYSDAIPSKEYDLGFESLFDGAGTYPDVIFDSKYDPVKRKAHLLVKIGGGMAFATEKLEIARVKTAIPSGTIRCSDGIPFSGQYYDGRIINRTGYLYIDQTGLIYLNIWSESPSDFDCWNLDGFERYCEWKY